MNEQFQYIKLNIDTPMANAPIVVTESPKWPAIIVLTMPMMGTVMLDMMLGSAKRNISRFILIVSIFYSRIETQIYGKCCFFRLYEWCILFFHEEMEHKLLMIRKFRLPLHPQIKIIL